MILPYAVRLLCLCLASFFVIHAALTAAAGALAPFTLSFAKRFAARRPSRAAALLLLLRLFPAAMAVAMVTGLCLPSFLTLEGEPGAEAAGVPFLVVSALGAAVLAISLARGARAIARSHRWMRRQFAVEAGAVWLSDGPAPFLGLGGVLRPRVLASRCVTQALDADQFAAALSHEWAHCASSDNLKRLLLLLAPEPLPGLHLFRGIDRAWSRFSEWAADDLAVAQDARRSVFLAEALVRVARLGAPPRIAPLVSRFLPPETDISIRVERLLNGPAPALRRSRGFAAAAACAFAAPFAAALLLPQSLGAVHQLLESLMH